MKVRIVKNSMGEHSWYADRIMQVFDATAWTPYGMSGWGYRTVNPENGLPSLISLEDAECVGIDKLPPAPDESLLSTGRTEDRQKFKDQQADFADALAAAAEKIDAAAKPDRDDR
ncbi:MAG: hypothetical protein WC073_03255 [Sterolibacterium sp.]